VYPIGRRRTRLRRAPRKRTAAPTSRCAGGCWRCRALSPRSTLRCPTPHPCRVLLCRCAHAASCRPPASRHGPAVCLSVCLENGACLTRSEDLAHASLPVRATCQRAWPFCRGWMRPRRSPSQLAGGRMCGCWRRSRSCAWRCAARRRSSMRTASGEPAAACAPQQAGRGGNADLRVPPFGCVTKRAPLPRRCRRVPGLRGTTGA
jgi:hypothetical protein